MQLQGKCNIRPIQTNSENLTQVAYTLIICMMLTTKMLRFHRMYFVFQSQNIIGDRFSKRGYFDPPCIWNSSYMPYKCTWSIPHACVCIFGSLGSNYYMQLNNGIRWIFWLFEQEWHFCFTPNFLYARPDQNTHRSIQLLGSCTHIPISKIGSCLNTWDALLFYVSDNISTT